MLEGTPRRAEQTAWCQQPFESLYSLQSTSVSFSLPLFCRCLPVFVFPGNVTATLPSTSLPESFPPFSPPPLVSFFSLPSLALETLGLSSSVFYLHSTFARLSLLIFLNSYIFKCISLPRFYSFRNNFFLGVLFVQQFSPLFFCNILVLYLAVAFASSSRFWVSLCALQFLLSTLAFRSSFFF